MSLSQNTPKSMSAGGRPRPTGGLTALLLAGFKGVALRQDRDGGKGREGLAMEGVILQGKGGKVNGWGQGRLTSLLSYKKPCPQ